MWYFWVKKVSSVVHFWVMKMEEGFPDFAVKYVFLEIDDKALNWRNTWKRI